MFSALHNTINTFMQDLQVHLVQCLVLVSGTLSSSPWFYQGAEGSSFIQAGNGIQSNQSFFG